MEKETIVHIAADAAIQTINKQLIDLDRCVMAVPESAKIVDLEPYFDLRRRFRGTFKTESITAFANYCHDNVREDVAAGCYVDSERMQAQAVMDLGNPHVAHHGDHTAVLSLKKTAAYSALLALNESTLSQKALAEWMEDWLPHLAARRDLETTLPITQAIANIRHVTIKATSQRDSVESNYSSTRSGLEQIDADSEQRPLPAFLEFTCIPYHELEERTFMVRVGLLTGNDDPAFRLRIIQLEQQQEDMADEFAGILKSAIDGSVPVTIGTLNLK